MKPLLLIIVLVLSSPMLFGQEVIQEAREPTEEEKRVYEISQEISKLQEQFAKSKMAYENKLYADLLTPNTFSLNAEKPQLLKKLDENYKALQLIDEFRLVFIDGDIERLRRSIGKEHNSAIDGIVNKLNNNIKQLNGALEKANARESQEKLEQEMHDSEMLKLENEIAELEKQLETRSTSNSANKTQSLEDILKKLNSGNNNKQQKSKSPSSINDLLSSSGKGIKPNSKTGNSSSIKDLLSKGDSETAESNSLGDLLGEAKNNDFEIKRDDSGKHGVVNSKGEVLLPFRSWYVREYKPGIGIAKVSIYIDSWHCDAYDDFYNFSYYDWRASKEGWVDANGDFIDGYNISFSSVEGVGKLALIAITGTIEDQKRARERRKKEEQLAVKRCQVEREQWKNSIRSRYE